MSLTPLRYPITIIDLGRAVVFHYQTENEFYAKVPYKEVYWKRKDVSLVYGPFDSVHDATNHFTKMLLSERNNSWYGSSNVLPVDFKNKRIIK